MATNHGSGASPKFKSFIKSTSPKNIGQKLKRRGSNKTSAKLSSFTDKSNQRDSGIDSDCIPLELLGSLSLSPQTTSQAAIYGHKVVVAIDFGTTHSGYAYSFTDHPKDIHLMRCPEGQRFGSSFNKVPTILLLNEKGGFHSFGYEARETYQDLDEDESQKWLYFEKFKLELHIRKDLNKQMELEACNGRRVLATIVFGHALRYFKDCCIKELNDVSITQSNFCTDDIQWVITVPAIWRQSAKQFMRHAAVQAGLLREDNWKQLIIALEPEAASIYCLSLRARECVPDTHSLLQVTSSPSPSTGAPRVTSSSSINPSSLGHHSMHSQVGAAYSQDVVCSNGMKYIVADCGGGTVDLTVHEVVSGSKLKELHKATGGAWGSMGVDCQFEMLLTDIFGETFLVDYVKSKPSSWLELVNTFETKKCAFHPSKQLSVNISLPFSFIESFKEKTGKSVETAVNEFGDGVQWTSQGMLRLQPSVLMGLFEPIVDTIVKHIQELLLLPGLSRIEYLFLVGGFAESPILQEAIKNAFRSHLKVVIPQNVGSTILKGAVMFGHDPTVVHIRRSTMTYGVGCLNKYTPGKHPPDKRVIKDGQEWCTGVFDAFVYTDQPISLGHSVTRSYTVAKTNQHSTLITLYASEKETVDYITDTGCSKVGQLTLGIPHLMNEDGSRELILSMMFGETEITVEAVDCASGQSARASFDFLCK